MSKQRRPLTSIPIDAEKVAYWYFRLNGFFQLENFIIHPERRGSQRTDADLIAVRFPYRAERLYDDPNDVMADDVQQLALSERLIDILIVEIKRNQPCTLNGPWTREDSHNIHRLLAAIGCLPPDRIDAAASDIYRTGLYRRGVGPRIRLVAVGRERNTELDDQYAEVTQLIWQDILAFIWARYNTFRNQKTQVDQWDEEGLKIKHLADRTGDKGQFVEEALKLMGVSGDGAR